MLLIKEVAHTELSVLQINMEKEKAMPLKNWLTRKEDTACPKLEASARYCTYVTHAADLYMYNKSDSSETMRIHTHTHVYAMPELLKAPRELP